MMNWKLAGRSLEYEEVSEILEIPLGYVTYLISITGFAGGFLTLMNAIVYCARLPIFRAATPISEERGGSK